MARGRDRQLIRDVIGWDVKNWEQALPFWEQYIGDVAGKRVLEIGATLGGLSLYFALRGCEVHCTDARKEWPRANVLTLHGKYGVSEKINYKTIYGEQIDFPAESFDIVCFKSVLGAIGWDDDFEKQKKTIDEMHRVLKPGGQLLFAENGTASPVHRFFRRHFVEWGKHWRYISVEEIPHLFDKFRQIELKPYGFLGVFGLSEFQRNMLHYLDVVLDPLIPGRYKYIIIGCATK